MTRYLAQRKTFKLNLLLAACLLLCAALLMSCGKEPLPEAPDIVAPNYQGAWRLAASASGEATPEVITCTAINGVNSRTETLNITKTGYIHLTIYFVSSTTCGGEHRIEIPREYKLLEESKTDSEQILTVASHSFTVNVLSERAALFLNTEKACGHEDWQEATYKMAEQNLKDCRDVTADTASNTGTLLFEIPSEATLANMRVRFSSQGDGIVLSKRIIDGGSTTGTASFDNDKTYLAK